MCAEYFCDQAVDLFETEDDVVIIGEVTIFLFVMVVSCKGHY